MVLQGLLENRKTMKDQTVTVIESELTNAVVENPVLRLWVRAIHTPL